MLKKVYFTLRDRPEDLDGLTGGVFVSGDKLFLEFLPETRCFLAFFGLFSSTSSSASSASLSEDVSLTAFFCFLSPLAKIMKKVIFGFEVFY